MNMNSRHLSDIRSVLTRHRAQGTLGSTDISSPHCGKGKEFKNESFPSVIADTLWLLAAGLAVFMATKG